MTLQSIFGCVLLAMAILVAPSTAALGCGDFRPLGLSIKPDGTRIGITIPQAAIMATSEWIPEREPVPLSISEAVEIAARWAEQKYGSPTPIDEIDLYSYSCRRSDSHWYYLFSFSLRRDNWIPVVGPEASVVVLMDGTVIGPEIVEQ